MKKTFLLAAAAALLLASCGKNEVFVPAQEDIPIGFNNYAPRSMTRANSSLVDSGALPVGSEIGIYGYSNGTTALPNDAAGVKPEFMDNAHVTYSGVTSETATASDPARYWPKTTENILSFYGYYPYQADVVTTGPGITAMPAASTAGLGSFSFTQSSDVDKMVDFMVSNVANDLYYYTDGTDGYAENTSGNKAVDGVVRLTFNHMLSKVNFQFSHSVDLATGDKIVLTSVSVANVETTGTLTPSYTAADGKTSFGWGSTGTSADITVPITDDGNGGQTLVKDTPKLNNGTERTETDFLFIPQTIGDDVTITIKYDIIQGSTTTHNTVEKKLNEIVFGSAALTSWERNNFYIYSFVIGLEQIKFTGNVIAWEDSGTGTLNI